MEEKMNMDNTIDIAIVIENFGSEYYDTIEGVVSEKTQAMIVTNIKKYSKMLDYQDSKEFTQILCDVVFTKILGEISESDESLMDIPDRIFDLLIFWDEALSSRYFLKSGINWLEE